MTATMSAAGGWDSEFEDDEDIDGYDTVGFALRANQGPRQNAKWFALKPRTYPKSLDAMATKLQSDWQKGVNTNVRHHGGRSDASLKRWFSSWVASIKADVVSGDGSKFFVARTSADQGRHERWLGHLRKYMFRSSAEPARDHAETEAEYAVLLEEFRQTCDQVVGWAANFILYVATSIDTQAQICAILSEGLVENAVPRSLAVARDWKILVEAYLADAGPEPNHDDLTRPGQLFAKSVFKDRNMTDLTVKLFATMRGQANTLRMRLQDVDASSLWGEGPGQPPSDHAGTSSSQSKGRGGVGAAAGGDGDDEDDGEDTGEAIADTRVGSGRGDIAERTLFDRREVDYLVDRAVQQTTARFIFGQHLGCTIDSRFRRELQRIGVCLAPGGDISFEDPFPLSDVNRTTCLNALDALVRQQCTTFGERQTQRATRDGAGGVPPRSRGPPRVEHGRGPPATPAPPAAPITSAGAEAAVPVTLLVESEAMANSAEHDKGRNTYCHRCDVGEDGKKRETTSGHWTNKCPYLTTCDKCKSKHTSTYDCQNRLTRQKQKSNSDRRGGAKPGKGHHKGGGGGGGGAIPRDGKSGGGGGGSSRPTSRY